MVSRLHCRLADRIRLAQAGRRCRRPDHAAHALSPRVADLCALYEKELKALNPNVRNITYDVADLYTYIDQLTDLNCLV